MHIIFLLYVMELNQFTSIVSEASGPTGIRPIAIQVFMAMQALHRRGGELKDKSPHKDIPMANFLLVLFQAL